jgi:hypothetical protein
MLHTRTGSSLQEVGMCMGHLFEVMNAVDFRGLAAVEVATAAAEEEEGPRLQLSAT